MENYLKGLVGIEVNCVLLKSNRKKPHTVPIGDAQIVLFYRTSGVLEKAITRCTITLSFLFEQNYS